MLCAVGVIVASSLHAFGGREIATLFSPMHFPVFLAGILCGPWLGLICGVMSPLISFLTTGGARPPFPTQLVPMIFELAVYGFLSGLLRRIFLKNPKTNKFSSILALVISMVAGRVVSAFVSVFRQSGRKHAGQVYYHLGGDSDTADSRARLDVRTSTQRRAA